MIRFVDYGAVVRWTEKLRFCAQMLRDRRCGHFFHDIQETVWVATVFVRWWMARRVVDRFIGSLVATNSDSGFFFVLSLLSCTKNSPIFSFISSATNMTWQPHKIDRHIGHCVDTAFVFRKLIARDILKWIIHEGYVCMYVFNVCNRITNTTILPM